MRERPLCVVCLFVLIAQSILFIMAGGNSLSEVPASSVFFEKQSETITVSGQVYQKQNHSNYQVLYLKNNSVKDSKILIYDDQFTKVSIGETIFLRGKILVFESAANPGNFDQALYYARLGFYGAIWCEEVLAATGETNAYREALFQIRTSWKEQLTEVLGEEEGTLLAAILLGDKEGMDAETKELYQKSGIGHILAISGLHVSFLGLGIYYLLRKMGMGYVLGGIGAIGILCVYVQMVGLSVSIFRAGLMLVLKIIADMTGRVYDMLTAVLLAATLTVLYQPLYLTDGGFYLSYGAVLGILVVLPAIKKCFSIRSRLLEGILASLAINISLFPILLYFYYEIPTYSVLLNAFVIPFMSVIIGCGMIGSGFLLGFEPLGRFLLSVCKMIFGIYEYLCQIENQLPASRLTMGQPKLWTIVIYYIVLFIILLCIRKKKKPKTQLWAFLVFCSLLFVRVPCGELEITMLNVGQGDCMFLQGPSGKSYLIDGGSSDEAKLGMYCIEPFLKWHGIGQLDYVFITHGDTDHYSGIEEMLKRQAFGVKIDCLVFPQNFQQDEALCGLAKLAGKVGCRALIMTEGESISEKELQITCIQPSETDTYTGNEGSLVLDVSFGAFSMLCTGDVEHVAEEDLTKRVKGKDYDVLKVAHHGSKNSSSEEFLLAIKPEIALISSGKNNRYRHPHPETLERLQKMRCCIYQTKENGAITLRSDGNSLTISLFPL